MDALQQFDAGIFSTLNGFHAYYFDSFMYLVTKIATWIPMILMLLYLLFIKKGWRKAIAIVLAIGLVILIADQVSASIIKPLVARARPSHNPDLASTIHIVNGYRGGPFGFVSSHAANCFGIALDCLPHFPVGWQEASRMGASLILTRRKPTDDLCRSHQHNTASCVGSIL